MIQTESGFKVAKLFCQIEELLKGSKFSIEELKLIKLSCEIVLRKTNAVLEKINQIKEEV